MPIDRIWLLTWSRRMAAWILGTGDEQAIAFAPARMEYLRELLAEHQTQSVIPAVLSVW